MVTRRDFLTYAAGAVAATMTPAVLARTPVQSGERALRFYNTHTGEQVSATYWVDGLYVDDELTAMNRVLRDHRTGDITRMDRQLFDLLYALQQRVESREAFHVISGYRSQRTNAMLNRRSGGVAKRSLHTLGKAIDIRLPGVELRHLRQAALGMRAGGVGYYPRSGFIHVDTGRPRFW